MGVPLSVNPGWVYLSPLLTRVLFLLGYTRVLFLLGYTRVLIVLTGVHQLPVSLLAVVYDSL